MVPAVLSGFSGGSGMCSSWTPGDPAPLSWGRSRSISSCAAASASHRRAPRPTRRAGVSAVAEGATAAYGRAMTTRQAPLHSGFGAQPTAREAIGDRDLRGAVAVVTGGYAGVGLETTRALAGAGATVIVGARTL